MGSGIYGEIGVKVESKSYIPRDGIYMEFVGLREEAKLNYVLPLYIYRSPSQVAERVDVVIADIRRQYQT